MVQIETETSANYRPIRLRKDYCCTVKFGSPIGILEWSHTVVVWLLVIYLSKGFLWASLILWFEYRS